MNTHDLTVSLDALTYPTREGYYKGKLIRTKEDRAAAMVLYRAEKAELEKQWKDWLHKDYAPSFSEDLHNHVFGKAWEDGHSHGYYEVEIHYEDLVDFVAKAIELNEA